MSMTNIIYLFSGVCILEIINRKSRYKKGGQLIRLTHGYMDGGMVSRPDSIPFNTQQKTRFLLMEF
jgi:hypothetical protein